MQVVVRRHDDQDHRALVGPQLAVIGAGVGVDEMSRPEAAARAWVTEPETKRNDSSSPGHRFTGAHPAWYRRRVVVSASAAIACTAIYWTIARLA